MLGLAAVLWSAAVVFAALGIRQRVALYISDRPASAISFGALFAAVFMSLHALALAFFPDAVDGKGLGLHDALALAERFAIAPALVMGNLGLATMVGVNYVRVRSGRRQGITIIALAALASAIVVYAMISGKGRIHPPSTGERVFVGLSDRHRHGA
jgi:hypothetical protein